MYPGSYYPPVGVGQPPLVLGSQPTVGVGKKKSSTVRNVSIGVVVLIVLAGIIVGALYATGNLDVSISGTQPLTPAGPKELKVTQSTNATSPKSVVLAWSVVPGNGVTYNVYRKSPTDSVPVKITTVSSNGYTDPGTDLTIGTLYTYSVTSVTDGTESAKSSESITLTVQVAPPTALTASNTTSSSVDLSWTASTTPGVTYNVYLGTNQTTPINATPLATTTTTYRVAGLTPSTSFTFVVKAVSGTATSVASNQVGITTTSIPAAAGAPSAPTTPTGIPTATSIALTWGAVTGAGITYNVYRNNITITTTSTPSYNDTPLTDGTSYTYAVQAVNAQGVVSALSTPLTISTLSTIPPAPTPFNAVYNSATRTVTLTWTPVPTAFRYRIFRGTTELRSNEIITAGPVIDGPLEAGNYTYTIKSVSSGGTESTTATSSNQVQVAAALTPLAAPTATPTSTQVVLSWVAPAAGTVTSYIVYRNNQVISPSTPPLTALTYIDTGLIPNTEYTYQVAYTSGGATSDKSPPRIVTTASIVGVLETATIGGSSSFKNVTAAAYAMKPLFTSYTGPHIRVSNGLIETSDVWFNIDGTVQKIVLASNGTLVSNDWITTGRRVVDIWYNQAPGGGKNNLIPTDFSQRPSVIGDENMGGYTVYFESGTRLNTTNVFSPSTTVSTMNLFMKTRQMSRASASAGRIVFLSLNGNNDSSGATGGRFIIRAPTSNSTWYWDAGNDITNRATVDLFGKNYNVGEVLSVSANKRSTDNKCTLTLYAPTFDACKYQGVCTGAYAAIQSTFTNRKNYYRDWNNCVTGTVDDTASSTYCNNDFGSSGDNSGFTQFVTGSRTGEGCSSGVKGKCIRPNEKLANDWIKGNATPPSGVTAEQPGVPATVPTEASRSDPLVPLSTAMSTGNVDATVTGGLVVGQVLPVSTTQSNLTAPTDMRVQYVIITSVAATDSQSATILNLLK